MFKMFTLSLVNENIQWIKASTFVYRVATGEDLKANIAVKPYTPATIAS